MMSRLARLRRIAAFAVPLLLQVVIGGAAGTCPLGDAMGGAAMAMPHSDPHAAHDPKPAAPTSHHHSAAHCDMACAPATCGASGQCATTAVSSSSTPATALASDRGREITGHDGAPLSVSIAPEPPPPRA